MDPNPLRSNSAPTRRTPRRGALSRRAVLRGAGAALALPWLEAMAPARGPLALPKRFAALFVPNGMLPEAWRPVQDEGGLTLSPTLAPLAPVQRSVTVLGNLFNKESRAGEGHYVKTTSWLSGAPVKRTGGRDLHVGTTIDQLIAARAGRETPLDALVLGVDPAQNRVDMGYSTVYGANISWRTPTEPAARELSPRRAFERLVRWTSVRGEGRRRAVLDLVRAEARSLRGDLGGADGRKLDEYLDSVHALDQRIVAFEANARSVSAIDASAAPEEIAPKSAEAFQQHVQLMEDLIVLAFRTDATRVATFMFGNSVSGRDFSFLDGVEGGHHHLSHHEDKDDMKAQYARINRWHVERFASLVQRLRDTREGDSNVLERSFILFGSGIADGNRHDPNDLPVLVGGGLFRGGRYLRQPQLTPLCNLYVSALRALGYDDERFGDSTGELAGLV
ncbi:MAG: DUF1552 domain-containing protein [Planctomycetota bacterium]